MGRFSDAAKDAAAETDKTFESEIMKLTAVSSKDLNVLFPDKVDRRAVTKLIEKLRKSTSQNHIRTALKSFSLAASEVAFKAARKLVLPALFLLATLPALAMAASMSFSEFLSAKAAETKGVYSLTWKGRGEPRNAGGFYVPINTLQAKDGAYDFADWGLGMEEPEGTEKPRLIVPLMINVVDLTRKIFSFRLAREHVRTTALPKVWIGPILHPPTQLSKAGLKKYIFVQNLGLGISAKFSSFLPDKKEGP